MENGGLGDKVEKVIERLIPKVSKKYKNCKGCKKRKEWLNNFNGKFS